jgi:hypothetical protein
LREFFPSTADVWVDAAQAIVDGQDDPTLQCENLICLTPEAHSYWNRGYFALKPVGDVSNTELKLQFFWQMPQISRDSRRPNFTHILRRPGSSRNAHAAGDGIWLNRTPFEPLTSGDVVTLKTSEPTVWPLPPRELLELQWHMSRVLRMAGGAEESWPDEDRDIDMVDCARADDGQGAQEFNDSSEEGEDRT